MDTNVNDKLIHAIDDLGHTIDDVVTFYHLHGDQMDDPAQNMVIGLIELLKAKRDTIAHCAQQIQEQSN